jgi:hypothetical protein
MPFKEIVDVFSKNHTKHVNTICEQNTELLIIKAGGTYGHHSSLKS